MRFRVILARFRVGDHRRSSWIKIPASTNRRPANYSEVSRASLERRYLRMINVKSTLLALGRNGCKRRHASDFWLPSNANTRNYLDCRESVELSRITRLTKASLAAWIFSCRALSPERRSLERLQYYDDVDERNPLAPCFTFDQPFLRSSFFSTSSDSASRVERS